MPAGQAVVGGAVTDGRGQRLAPKDPGQVLLVDQLALDIAGLSAAHHHHSRRRRVDTDQTGTRAEDHPGQDRPVDDEVMLTVEGVEARRRLLGPDQGLQGGHDGEQRRGDLAGEVPWVRVVGGASVSDRRLRGHRDVVRNSRPLQPPPLRIHGALVENGYARGRSYGAPLGSPNRRSLRTWWLGKARHQVPARTGANSGNGGAAARSFQVTCTRSPIAHEPPTIVVKRRGPSSSSTRALT